MKITANIVSKGTEISSGCKGYMALTENVDGVKYLLPITRDVKCVNELPTGFLTINKKLSLEQIAVARFTLIPYLFFKRTKFKKNKKICIIGTGCVGFATLLCLKQLGYQNVFYASRNKFKKYFPKFINLERNYRNFKDFDIVVDATGNNNVIHNVIETASPFTTIVLLGTPRDDIKFSSLLIHRKNLNIFGAHELSGFSDEKRRKAFCKVQKNILKLHKNFKDIAKIFNYRNFSYEKMTDCVYAIIEENGNENL